MPIKETKKINFSESFKQLEKIVEGFEREEIDLEEGLKKFETGLELAAKCKSRLAEIENKVKEIKRKFDKGGLVERDTLL